MYIFFFAYTHLKWDHTAKGFFLLVNSIIITPLRKFIDLPRGSILKTNFTSDYEEPELS